MFYEKWLKLPFNLTNIINVNESLDGWIGCLDVRYSITPDRQNGSG